MYNILLIEDDAALAMGTEYALKAEGYAVIHAENLDVARRTLWENESSAGVGNEAGTDKRVDIILLDVMLPDGNGFDFIKEIREHDVMTPVIFLTAVGDEVNIVQGLDSGADDYVTEPYRVRELLSRIAAVLRRQKIMSDRRAGSEEKKSGLVFGSHRIDKEGFRLYKDDSLVDCTAAEFRLLKELAEHPGQVITRSALMDSLYETGDSFIDDNTLSVYMKRLRDKLGDDAEYIETVRGVGYRFRDA